MTAVRVAVFLFEYLLTVDRDGYVCHTAGSAGLDLDVIYNAVACTPEHIRVYMIKPSLMIKGDDRKRNRLIIEYENVKHEKENKE